MHKTLIIVVLIKKLTFNYMYDSILNKEVYTMKKYIKILIIALFTISIITFKQ